MLRSEYVESDVPKILFAECRLFCYFAVKTNQHANNELD